MVDVRAEEKLAVRFKADDLEALDWLVAYVQEHAGAGVRIERSDAIRWALHTCRAGLESESQTQEGR